jgi:hypothetical protein
MLIVTSMWTQREGLQATEPATRPSSPVAVRQKETSRPGTFKGTLKADFFDGLLPEKTDPELRNWLAKKYGRSLHWELSLPAKLP